MLINTGRLLMLLVWGVLLYNIFVPFTKPLNTMLDIAFGFMVVMHALKLLMFRTTLTPDQPKLTKLAQCRLFVFGVFELLAWQRKWQNSQLQDNGDKHPD